MTQTIEEVENGQESPAPCTARRRSPLAHKIGGGGAAFVGVASAPGRVWAQIDDAAPSNDGLPGGALIAQVISWGKWVALAACVLAIVYGAATWKGMGGNSGRGVEGKAYVGAGMLGAMIIGIAVVAVNTLYDAGNAGG